MVDKVQSLRDLVRPIMTIMITGAYIGIVGIATWKGSIDGKEALTAIGTPFMMILTYHFAKGSKKDDK